MREREPEPFADVAAKGVVQEAPQRTALAVVEPVEGVGEPVEEASRPIVRGHSHRKILSNLSFVWLRPRGGAAGSHRLTR